MCREGEGEGDKKSFAENRGTSRAGAQGLAGDALQSPQ